MNMATEDTTDEATAVSRDLHEVLDELDAQNPMSDIGRALLVRRVGGDAPIDDTTPPRAISLVVLYSDGVSDARLEIGPANRPSESAGTWLVPRLRHHRR